MKADRETAKTISALCGKLKSAWSLQVGFGTRLNGLLPEIAALPSEQIDACFERATKGDPLRAACMVPIACEHLFHPSLHHRIARWLEDDSLPFRDTVLSAIGRFRLHQFARDLEPFFRPKDDREKNLTFYPALHAASLLKLPESLPSLRQCLIGLHGQPAVAMIRDLLHFPGFDAKPWLQTWFHEAEVIDEIGICERYIAGSISYQEEMELSQNARVIWQLAEWYGEHEKQEVIEFLVKHLDFEQTWFSSQKFSKTIVCRGHVATRIIAKLNRWQPVGHEHTKESSERSNLFYSSLWTTLRAAPSLAFQSDCPVRYEFPPKHKIHKQIDQLLNNHGRILEDNPELGYSLRQANERDDLLLALHAPSWNHWRIIRLSDSDKHALKSGQVPTDHLFFKYSSRGALVAFHNHILINASDLENKFAKSAIRKQLKIEARKAVKKGTLN